MYDCYIYFTFFFCACVCECACARARACVCVCFLCVLKLKLNTYEPDLQCKMFQKSNCDLYNRVPGAPCQVFAYESRGAVELQDTWPCSNKLIVLKRIHAWASARDFGTYLHTRRLTRVFVACITEVCVQMKTRTQS